MCETQTVARLLHAKFSPVGARMRRRASKTENVTQFLNISVPQKLSFARVLWNFQGLWQVRDRLAINIWRFAQGVMELWEFNRGGAFSPKFSASSTSRIKTFKRYQNGKGFFYHHAKFVGAGSSRSAAEGVKKFYVYICTRYQWPWLGPPLTAIQHVKLNERVGQNQRLYAYDSSSSQGGGTGAKYAVSDCNLFLLSSNLSSVSVFFISWRVLAIVARSVTFMVVVLIRRLLARMLTTNFTLVLAVSKVK